MKKLNFIYKVQYSFTQPIYEHNFALRILPKTNEEQGIYATEYHIFGGSSCAEMSQESYWTTDECIREMIPEGKKIDWELKEGSGSIPCEDGFDNRLIAGRIGEPHDWFAFVVKGTAYTRREMLRKRTSSCAPFYRFSTDLTRPGESIRNFYEKNREHVHREAMASAGLPGGVSRGRARIWMHLVAEHFQYTPGATDIRTTAEGAMTMGQGVCQDYTHVLITLLRLDGIPARYIAGMLIGEGATHAWCEAWCEGYWVGLDPTNDCPLNDNYIEVAHGRDYRDCIMDRGAFRGYALQTQNVYVKVGEYEPVKVSRLGIL